LIYDYPDPDSVDEEGSSGREYVEIWNAIQFSRDWDIHLEKLEGLFEGFWDRLDKDHLKMREMRQLIYPCQAFEHREAFAYISKKIAHEGVGHFEEINPSRHIELHLNKQVIRKLSYSSMFQKM
jgi:hypothetical protein